jgi:drug/metabolite transporter (DMT)-like permease
MDPSEIFFCRFLLAYISIWGFSWRKILADNLHDEALFFASGLTGGSLYFMFENTALSYTLASNVSLILCTAPILTTLVNFLFHRGERIHSKLVYGSLMAFTGVALVVYNGGVILKLNPLGDMLTIVAALMWAFYSLIIKNLSGKYSTFFITRKVFFYGLLTILPVFIFQPFETSFKTLLHPEILLNLLFLGMIASMLCYLMWNLAARKLGIIRITMYIYFSPLVTLLASSILIDETITIVALVGSAFILSGVLLAERGRR